MGLFEICLPVAESPSVPFAILAAARGQVYTNFPRVNHRNKREINNHYSRRYGTGTSIVCVVFYTHKNRSFFFLLCTVQFNSATAISRTNWYTENNVGTGTVPVTYLLVTYRYGYRIFCALECTVYLPFLLRMSQLLFFDRCWIRRQRATEACGRATSLATVPINDLSLHCRSMELACY